jgi:hypothetical protein
MLDSGLELCDLVKALNITGDAALETVRAGLEQAITGVSLEDLRKNTMIRNDVRKDVDAILKNISW